MAGRSPRVCRINRSRSLDFESSFLAGRGCSLAFSSLMIWRGCQGFREASTPAVSASPSSCLVSTPSLRNAYCKGAYDGLVRSGAQRKDITIVRVPGAFEIPSAARTLAETKNYDAILCIGCLPARRHGALRRDCERGHTRNRAIGAGNRRSACVRSAERVTRWSRRSTGLA